MAHKNKIIGGASLLGIFILIIIFIFSSKEKELITYKKKYVSEAGDLWVEFYEDGTCKRSIDSTSCKYEIKENIISLKEEQTVYGASIKLEMHYKIIDKVNLEHTYTCYPDVENVDSILYCNGKESLISTYSLNNNYVEKQKEQDDTSENKTDENTEKDMRMLHIEDDFYYVCYSNDSTQRILFGFREDGSYKMVYSKLKMSITSAKYETEKELEGKYYADNNYVYTDNVKSEIVFGPSTGTPTQIFNFGGLDCYVKNSNPTDDNSSNNDNIDNSGVDENPEKNDTNDINLNKEDTGNKNKNNNSSNTTPNNPVDNTPIISTEEELTKKSKELLDKATVELKPDTEDYFKVNIEAPGFSSSTIKVDNKSYGLYDYIKVRCKNDGANCIDITLEDSYGNTRVINKCINFHPKTPNYEAWIYNLAPNGICEMRIKNLVLSSQYNEKELTCVINNEKTFDCSNGSAFSVPLGTYSLTITNRYGLSQTIQAVCQK